MTRLLLAAAAMALLLVCSRKATCLLQTRPLSVCSTVGMATAGMLPVVMPVVIFGAARAHGKLFTEAAHAGCAVTVAVFIVHWLQHHLHGRSQNKKLVAAAAERLWQESQRIQDCEETMRLRQEAAALRNELQETKVNLEGERRRADAAEAKVAALREQFEELLLEHDRVLEHNQILQAEGFARRKTPGATRAGSSRATHANSEPATAPSSFHFLH